MKFNKPIYIIIGTRAQFIKMAPLLRKMLDQDIPYHLIYTAQHQENIDEILETYQLPPAEIVMFEHDEAKTKVSFIYWFFTLITRILLKSKTYLPTPGFVMTHGDTFTAWMAALMGKLAKCKVCHVESGLRSFNLFSPFPEEISRLLTFRLSDIYLCPNETAIRNLKNFKGEKINTKGNTLLDGVRFALSQNEKRHYHFQDSPYAIVSLHRYENIFTFRFRDQILPILKRISEKYKLVFTLHPTTRERLHSLDKFEELNNNVNIVLHERFSFVDWIKICDKAEFVITDGGSNQEELSYLGVPTMLFRHETERVEGLDNNIIITNLDTIVIQGFLNNYPNLRKDHSFPKVSPSQIIIETLYQLSKENYYN